ncbi:hypothetical protein HDA32_000158 [Spinactinospora alkalitolerans]|uniref:DUF1440 domain-containing protein n=1 Tax=Spinactinospora alkalitolerans TaxID=687207 RepID=A0A852TM74_9ACTN|nr:hypothetical protein [Spinactinospora alkalitolerans]NYE45038.1 hypothetical protein [Spinactinospora alkalitolerans]
MAFHGIIRGLIAGAAGTTALNAATYLDMAVRGRPASSTPEQSVDRLADRADVSLGEGEEAENRRSGLGPMLGIATGLGVAAGYRAVLGRRLPWAVETGALTLLAMAGSAAPMTLLGITDPRTWSGSDWMADLVPHLAYGATAATALRLIDE